MGCKLYAWEWPGHQPFCNLLFRFVAIRIAYYIYVSAYLSVQCKWAVNNSNNNKNNHDDDDDNDNEEKTRIADRYILCSYSSPMFLQWGRKFASYQWFSDFMRLFFKKDWLLIGWSVYVSVGFSDVCSVILAFGWFI